MENNPFLKGKQLKKTGLLDTIVNEDINNQKLINEKQLQLMQNSEENIKKEEISRNKNDKKVVYLFDLIQEK